MVKTTELEISSQIIPETAGIRSRYKAETSSPVWIHVTCPIQSLYTCGFSGLAKTKATKPELHITKALINAML